MYTLCINQLSVIYSDLIHITAIGNVHKCCQLRETSDEHILHHLRTYLQKHEGDFWFGVPRMPWKEHYPVRREMEIYPTRLVMHTSIVTKQASQFLGELRY
jgi:hypothetical protein